MEAATGVDSKRQGATVLGKNTIAAESRPKYSIQKNINLFFNSLLPIEEIISSYPLADPSA